MNSIQVIGHRGNKADCLENTLQGFESIFKNPELDGVELDVVVSCDQQLFVAHDMYVEFGEARKWHHEREYAQIIESTDAKFFSSDKYPLLEQVFQLYLSCDSKHNFQIEIKSEPSISLPLSIDALIFEVHSLIHKYDLVDMVTITSFDYRYLVESKKQNFDIMTGMIMHRCLLPVEQLLSLPIDSIVFEKNWVTSKDIAELNSANILSYAWTANNKDEWQRLRDMGVTGIITDKPQGLVDWLRG